MNTITFSHPTRAMQAHAARAEVEVALDLAGWSWSWRLSHWIDALVALEEWR